MSSHAQVNQSILVLPFINLSPTLENDYFSDGISEEIINALAKIDRLKVLARTTSFSFKGKHIDIREIGEQVNVQTILEGSIRRSGDRIRITAQLIETKEGTHLWSENFDRKMDDIFTLQDEISLQIADKIRENFGHFDVQDHLVQKQTDSIRAYELFLEARFYQLQWTPESLKKAVELYLESTKNDAHFARSYYGLVQSYGLLAAWGYMPQKESFQLAGECFIKAREIDATLPEYHISLIGKSFWGEWDYPLTYQLLLQALDANPHYSDAVEAIAELMIANGYFAEADKHIRMALETDPLSANHHYTLANIFYYQKDFSNALNNIEKALHIYPEFQLPKELRLMCYIHINDSSSLERYISESHKPQLVQLLYDVMNDGTVTIEKPQVDELIESSKSQHILVPYELYILANSKDYPDAAIGILSEYVMQKRGQIINFRFDPLLSGIQHSPEVKRLYPKQLELDTLAVTGELSDKKTEKLSDEEINYLVGEIHRLMEEEEVFLSSKLNLRLLAEQMNVHSNKLSLFINLQYNKNFNEYINAYRLNHFQKIALDDQYAYMSILGKAFESGFNSKSVFNSFFKKQIGLSPKEWIKEQAI